MTTSRHAYKVDANNPGSDVAGETAAAMAAASIVFRETNPHYSHLLLHHAQQVRELMRLLYKRICGWYTIHQNFKCLVNVTKTKQKQKQTKNARGSVIPIIIFCCIINCG